MAPALELELVSFAYRAAPVFTGFDLRVAEAEVIAILGPNGAGKSTLLGLAGGHLRPAPGRVRVFGTDLAAMQPRERARVVAVVPQDSRLAFDFTAFEVVLMGRAPHLGLLGLESARDHAIARAAMRRTDVEELSARPFSNLSGGERQRVVLARALAQEPRLLLLDEPTVFLDLKHRLAIYEMLGRLNREAGLTVVIASHDMDLAARYCDRIVVLHRGGIAGDGPPGDVLRPELLREVYEVEAQVIVDPASGRPRIVPIAPLGSG